MTSWKWVLASVCAGMNFQRSFYSRSPLEFWSSVLIGLLFLTIAITKEKR